MIAARRRVAVIGLFASQVAHVLRAVPGDMTLTVIDRDAVNLPAADLVIVMTKFVSHRHSEKCFAAYGRDRVVLCSGGLSRLKNLLAEKGG